MWSAWSERVQVYLGSGLVLVQRPGAPLWIFEPPATLPLADVFKQMDEALGRARAKPWRLRVHLSAAFCPPVVFPLPKGINRYAEVEAIAQASAAQAWAIPPARSGELVCCIDQRHRGLAGALLGVTQRQIVQWAAGYRGSLVSLRPLWAVASDARVCREGKIQNLAVLEPDGLTLLQVSESEPVRAMSWLGTREAGEAKLQAIDWWGQAGDLDRTAAVFMAFSKEPVTSFWLNGPSAWIAHWKDFS